MAGRARPGARSPTRSTGSSDGPGPVLPGLVRGVRELVALALPTSCGSCGEPGERVCRVCRAALGTEVWSPPRPVAPTPAPPGCPPVVGASAYAGVVAALVRAHKDEARADLAPELSTLLARSVAAVVAGLGPGPVLLVPVPSSRSSRRRRGGVPLHDLVDLVVGGSRGSGVDLRVAAVLRHQRSVGDQAGLGAAERAANLRGALAVPTRLHPRVRGSTCVLVDDVLTTGATLTEATRALREAGAARVLAATVAATERRAHAASRPGHTLGTAR